MKDKIFEVLQRIGRSFMLPIAILPVAGLLLGLGSSFTNETTIATYHLGGILGNGTILHALLVIMNKVEVPCLITCHCYLLWVSQSEWQKKKKKWQRYLR